MHNSFLQNLNMLFTSFVSEISESLKIILEESSWNHFAFRNVITEISSLS